MWNINSAFVETAAIVPFSPLYIIFFVSNRCWMSCRHCWFNEEWKERNIIGPPLSFDEIEKTASLLNKPQFVSLCGGEAFMRDDIVELTSMFLKRARMKRYQIPTSGFDTDKIVKSTAAILERNNGIPFRVDVSLDGLEDTHNFIRGNQDSFRAAVSTIKQLVKFKKVYNYFDMGIMSTVNKYNQEQVHELGKFVSGINDGGEWMVKILRGTPRDAAAGGVSAEKYFQVHEIINSHLRNKKIIGHRGHFSASLLSAKNSIRRNIIYRIENNGYYPGTCSAASLICVVNIDGEIRPCEMLDDSVGNLRDHEYNFKKILTSPTAKQFRKTVIRNRCTCTHECVLSTSILLQPKHIIELIGEWLRIFRLRSNFGSWKKEKAARS